MLQGYIRDEEDQYRLCLFQVNRRQINRYLCLQQRDDQRRGHLTLLKGRFRCPSSVVSGTRIRRTINLVRCRRIRYFRQCVALNCRIRRTSQYNGRCLCAVTRYIHLEFLARSTGSGDILRSNMFTVYLGAFAGLGNRLPN